MLDKRTCLQTLLLKPNPFLWTKRVLLRRVNESKDMIKLFENFSTWMQSEGFPHPPSLPPQWDLVSTSPLSFVSYLLHCGHCEILAWGRHYNHWTKKIKRLICHITKCMKILRRPIYSQNNFSHKIMLKPCLTRYKKPIQRPIYPQPWRLCSPSSILRKWSSYTTG